MNSIQKDRSSTSLSKILFTLFILSLFRFGNSIPLTGIDQIALQNSFNEMGKNTAVLQLVNMYSGGLTRITFFSLGIIPYINASMIVDLLSSLIPSLEKLQTEEGEIGKRKLLFYKKIVTFGFALIQASLLIVSIQPYFYESTFFSFFLFGLHLVTGSLVTIWLTNLIDNKGIGNGTSLFIFANIAISFFSNQKTELFSTSFSSLPLLLQNSSLLFQLFFLLLFLVGICLSQLTRLNIEVISAKQGLFGDNEKDQKEKEKQFLGMFGKKQEKNENGLSIRFNQAGIFPIIIAANLFPFLSSFIQSFFGEQKIFLSVLYYVLIIVFNYFYTSFFWEPSKISEQLRKSSVSLFNISPGKETTSYLENVVQASSFLGGLFLCGFLSSYNFVQFFSQGELLKQINVSSLLILSGVSFEIQKTLRALFTNRIFSLK